MVLRNNNERREKTRSTPRSAPSQRRENPQLKEQIETSFRGGKGRVISGAVRQESKLSRDIISAASIGSRSTLSALGRKNAGGSLLDAARMVHTNEQLVRAWVDDLRGDFIEGGLLGLLGNNRTALEKALKNILEEHGQPYAEKVMGALRGICSDAQSYREILNKKKTIGNGAKNILRKLLYIKTDGDILHYWETSPDFRAYKSDMLKKKIRGLIFDGILFAATGVVHIGNVRLPFGRKVGNTSPDDVSKRITGESIETTVFKPLRLAEEKVDGKNISQGEADKIRKDSLEFLGRAVAGYDIQRDARSMFAWLPGITAIKRPIVRKVENYINAVRSASSNDQKMKAIQNLLKKVYDLKYREEKNGKNANDADIAVFSHIILVARALEISIKADAISEGRSSDSILDDDRNIRGKGILRGKPGVEIGEHGVKFGRDVRDKIGNGAAMVKEMRNKRNGVEIADLYVQALKSCCQKLGLNISGNDKAIKTRLLNGIAEGDTGEIVGQNYSINTRAFSENKGRYPGHVFRMEISTGFYVTMAVKGDCTNLIVGNTDEIGLNKNAPLTSFARATLLFKPNGGGSNEPSNPGKNPSGQPPQSGAPGATHIHGGPETFGTATPAVGGGHSGQTVVEIIGTSN